MLHLFYVKTLTLNVNIRVLNQNHSSQHDRNVLDSNSCPLGKTLQSCAFTGWARNSHWRSVYNIVLELMLYKRWYKSVTPYLSTLPILEQHKLTFIVIFAQVMLPEHFVLRSDCYSLINLLETASRTTPPLLSTLVIMYWHYYSYF